MKFYVEKTEMTQAEAEAAQTKTKRLAEAHEVLQMPWEEFEGDIRDLCPLRIAHGLLVRYDDVLLDGRVVVALYDPSDVRFGVLYVIDEKPHKHKWVKQPRKCEECGEIEK